MYVRAYNVPCSTCMNINIPFHILTRPVTMGWVEHGSAPSILDRRAVAERQSYLHEKQRGEEDSDLRVPAAAPSRVGLRGASEAVARHDLNAIPYNPPTIHNSRPPTAMPLRVHEAPSSTVIRPDHDVKRALCRPGSTSSLTAGWLACRKPCRRTTRNLGSAPPMGIQPCHGTTQERAGPASVVHRSPVSKHSGPLSWG